MYISVRRDLLKGCLIYAIAVVFTAVFGAVYESFSHEVYSSYMIYAFAIPLVLGLLPLLCFAVRGKEAPVGWAGRMYNSGVAALTVGSVFEGVLEIYGTTNRLVAAYPIAGVILILAGGILFLMQGRRRKG